MSTDSKVIARTDRHTDKQIHIHDKNITSTAYARGNYGNMGRQFAFMKNFQV